MLFNSWTFIFFFFLVLGLYWLLPHRRQNVLLVLASYGFYAAWDWRFLALLSFSTLVDFIIAQRIESTSDTPTRKRLLLISVVVNLGLLGTFKYFHFFVDSGIVLLTQLGFEVHTPLIQVILPVGISFYTFQTMAYTIDVYRGQQKAVTNLVTYALYVSFFPQLVAGPIERASRLLPQFEKRRILSVDDVSTGAQLVLWGYLKKVAIADTIAPFVDAAYSDPASYNGVYLWLAVYGFAFQLYCDFSGYTDMARGFSRLLGIRLVENFRAPFLARNIAEFWRRWHISLSTWLRDYLYVPLGGNRHGRLRLYRNLMITMVLGGLWHGAGWTFVLWGALQGFFLILHRESLRLSKKYFGSSGETGWLSRVLHGVYVLCTFHLMALLFVVFRAPDMATLSAFLTSLLNSDSWSTGTDVASNALLWVIVVYGLVIAVHDCLLLRSSSDVPLDRTYPWWVRGVLYGVGLALLAYVRGVSSASFVYFQF